MGRVSDYSFINAKLRARIGIMHDPQLVDSMIKAPSLTEAVAKLDGTRYQQLSEVYRPRISIVTQPLDELGEQTARLLLERLSNPGAPPRTVTLPADILPGDTLGAPKNSN